MEPTQQSETQDKRIGIIVVLGIIALAPVVLALWFWACSLMFTAWHLMTVAFAG